MKQQLEFAKICVEVDANSEIPGSVMVELENGFQVDVGVELVWAPPKCDQCHVFGHVIENCWKNSEAIAGGLAANVVVENSQNGHIIQNEIFGFVDGSVEANKIVNIPVVGGFDSIPDTEKGDVVFESEVKIQLGIENSVSAMGCADVTLVVEERVVAHIDEILGPEPDALSNANQFEVLDENQEVVVPSPKKSRIAAEGVADLMNKLKPKGKGGAKTKKQGKSGKRGGDFNIIWCPQESSDFDGGQHISGATQDFLHCLEEVDVLDHPYIGATITWQVAARQKFNSIKFLENAQGHKLNTFEEISGELIQHFTKALGTANGNVGLISDALLREILGVELSANMKDSLVAPVTSKEIKDVIFSMNGSKAPGPDG
ncbi:hypothetical protein V6N13_047255 [Hibiscus sabdariffa]